MKYSEFKHTQVLRNVVLMLILLNMSGCTLLGTITSTYKELFNSVLSIDPLVNIEDKIDVCSNDSCSLEEDSKLLVLYCNKCKVSNNNLTIPESHSK